MLKLVPYSETVFQALFAWQNDDEIRKDMGGLSVPMREDELVFMYQQFLLGTNAVLGVETEEGIIVGAFLMDSISPRHKRMNVHIVFDREYRRHVAEGCKLFMDYVFNEKNIDWLHCYIGMKNEQSINLVEKLGFIKRSIITDYFNFQDGPQSACLYSLHKDKRKEL